MTLEKLTIRRANPEDALSIIETHRNAIREKASSSYDKAIIDLWAPLEITVERIEKLKKQIEGQEWLTIVAEAEGLIIGFGQVNSTENVLGAVYVQKNSYGTVGKRILEKLISYAKEQNAEFLEMDASLNSEAFYQAEGFKVIKHDKHIMSSGAEMACVKMRLDL